MNTRRRSGFALPMVLLVLAFLTVTVVAAYSATSTEFITNSAQKGESRAFMLAQAGLESFMARRNEVNFCDSCGFPPAVKYESTTVKLPGGYAQVVAQRVRIATSVAPAIYLLRSRGVDTVSKVSGGGRLINGERTVAQLVYWNVNQVNVLAGWTSLSGLNKNGSSGTISGIDQCAAKPAVAGIALPTGDYSGNAKFTPEGSPPFKYLGTQAQADSSALIDWAGIVSGERVQPDVKIPGGSWPTAAFVSNPNYYPVIKVTGNYSLPADGRGTLIVTGDLTIGGSSRWQGIIMVGGVLTSNGTSAITGATMSGLNQLLGQTVGAATANGTKTYQYNSCEVAKAAAGLASYSVFPNAWMDNYASY
jgi:hypothetical protein